MKRFNGTRSPPKRTLEGGGSPLSYTRGAAYNLRSQLHHRGRRIDAVEKRERPMLPAVLLRRLAAATLLLAAFAANAFFIGPPPLLLASVKEYVNDITGHYVLLSDPAEVQG